VNDKEQFICKLLLAMLHRWIFVLKKPSVAVLPNTPSHENNNLHREWNTELLSQFLLIYTCRRFDPGRSLDRRVNCRCVSQPRWVGARWNTRGKTAASCYPAPRADALAVGGYKRSQGRERESLSVSPFSRADTFSYEGPGPSFYRCKEKAQVYNGGCSNVLMCLAERIQSPMYMPTWLSERC
jgi:hypothetical protein